MLIRIPEALKGKVTFTLDSIDGGVKVVEGATLTEEEEKLFLQFRGFIKKREKARFED